jgi:hypothetical protein
MRFVFGFACTNSLRQQGTLSLDGGFVRRLKSPASTWRRFAPLYFDNDGIWYEHHSHVSEAMRAGHPENSKEVRHGRFFI